MGRNRSSITTKEVKRIDLGYLLRNKFIEKGKTKFFTLSWTNDNNISVFSKYTKEEQFIKLSYTNSDYWTNEKTEHDYKIQIALVPSNLGKGYVPYLVCPVSGLRCRILYKAYGSEIWKARKAYKKTIFYESQTSSKYSRYNDEYWRLEKEIKRLRNQKRWQTHYKRKETRRYKRYKRLLQRQREADHLRWHPSNLPIAIRKFTNEYGHYG